MEDFFSSSYPSLYLNIVMVLHLTLSCIESYSSFARTALSAEWTPPAGSKWVEKDFEKDIQKLEKEAEERLDKKIAELKDNIATVGKP